MGHPEVTAVLCQLSLNVEIQPERYKVNCFLMTDGAGLENKEKKTNDIELFQLFFSFLDIL